MLHTSDMARGSARACMRCHFPCNTCERQAGQAAAVLKARNLTNERGEHQQQKSKTNYTFEAYLRRSGGTRWLSQGHTWNPSFACCAAAHRETCDQSFSVLISLFSHVSVIRPSDCWRQSRPPPAHTAAAPVVSRISGGSTQRHRTHFFNWHPSPDFFLIRCP